jgi:hypothetical protein
VAIAERAQVVRMVTEVEKMIIPRPPAIPLCRHTVTESGHGNK